jgi:hypothetical protein
MSSETTAEKMQQTMQQTSCGEIWQSNCWFQQRRRPTTTATATTTTTTTTATRTLTAPWLSRLSGKTEEQYKTEQK